TLIPRKHNQMVCFRSKQLIKQYLISLLGILHKLIIGDYFYIRTSWCIISEIPFSIWCLIKTCILSIGGKAIRNIRYYITIESGILYISKPSTICLLHLSCFYIGNISQNLIDGILVIGSKIISLRLLQFNYAYRVYILCIRRI